MQNHRHRHPRVIPTLERLSVGWLKQNFISNDTNERRGERGRKELNWTLYRGAEDFFTHLAKRWKRKEKKGVSGFLKGGEGKPVKRIEGEGIYCRSPGRDFSKGTERTLG